MFEPRNSVNNRISKLERALRLLTKATYRAEVSGARVTINFVDLPATGYPGQIYWVNDGRKPGEGAGNGTGVPASWNPATLTFISDYDQNTVTA